MSEKVRFHVLPEGSQAMNDAFKSVSIEPAEIVAALEDYCRGVIEERAKFLGIDAKISAQLDRRVEVAVKAALDRMQPRLATMADELLREKVRALVAGTPINVTVSVGA